MNIFLILIISLATLYSCSPVNKQHGYLLDDIVISAEKISEFETDKSTKNDIFAAMGSPSIEIDDINDVWIYLISLKEKKVFEEDLVKYQSIMKFAFNENNILSAAYRGVSFLNTDGEADFLGDIFEIYYNIDNPALSRLVLPDDGNSEIMLGFVLLTCGMYIAFYSCPKSNKIKLIKN